MAYYVTVRDGQRVGWLAGPFNRHGDALRMVEPCRKAAKQVNDRAIWYSFGTARRKADRDKVGLFNDQLGLNGRPAHNAGAQG